VVEFGTGIGEIISDNGLLVYPNPNHGLFTAELELNQVSDIEIELNNVLGQRVYYNRLQQQRFWRKEFNMTSYVSAVYLLRVTTDKGVLQRRIILD
jgi:hypothetical protein